MKANNLAALFAVLILALLVGGGQLVAAAGLVESTRGRGGGLRLKRAPRRISMLDIVTVMGANGVKLSPCVVRRGGCSRSARCRVHRELQSVQDVVDKRLQALTLDRLV